MRQVVAAITLTGGVGSAAEARKMVELVSGVPDQEMVQAAARSLSWRAPQYVSGLEPDLLGEAMVWRVLNKASAGAGPYLDRVFEGATAQVIRTGFAVLGRLSEDHEEADGWIAHMLEHDIAGRAMEAFAAAKSVGERTAHAGAGEGVGEGVGAGRARSRLRSGWRRSCRMDNRRYRCAR